MGEKDDIFEGDLVIPTAEYMLAIGEPLVKATVMPEKNQADRQINEVYMNWGEWPHGDYAWRGLLSINDMSKIIGS